MPELDVFKRYLEENPDVAYYSAMPSFLNPGQREFFFGRFPQVYREYQQQLGTDIRGEKRQKTTFETFLQNYPWMENYSNAAGGAPFRTAPMTRWLF